MSITLWIYKKPLEPIETEVIAVESSVLKKREILPDGKVTKCEAKYRDLNEVSCGQFDQETHHVTREEDGRISRESRVGECKLTKIACGRVAEHLEIAVRSEREIG